MAKKTLTINGSGGGFLEDTSLTDLITDGKGKDEAQTLNSIFSDKKGCLTLAVPGLEDNADVDNLAEDGDNDLNSDQLLIHDDKIYQNDGLYKLGDDVNWSDNTDHQVPIPTSTVHVNDAFVQLSDDCHIKFVPSYSDALLLFVGCENYGGDISPLHPYPAGDQTDALLFGKTTIDYPRDYIARTLSGAHGGWDWGTSDTHPTYGGDAGWYPSQAGTWGDSPEGGNTIRVQEANGQFSGLEDETSDVDISDIAYFRWANLVDDDVGGENVIRFRVGKYYFSEASDEADLNDQIIDSSEYGASPGNLNGKDMLLDVHIPDTDAQSKLNGLYIFWKSRHPDALYGKVRWADHSSANPGEDDFYDPYSKIWKISANELEKAGCFEGYGVVRAPYSALVHEGVDYMGDVSIHEIGFGFNYNAKQSGPTNAVAEVRAFILANPKDNSWGGQNVQFLASRLSPASNHNARVESLLKTYTNTGLGYVANLPYQTHNLIIKEPNNADAAGKIYYQKVSDEGTGYGDLFYMAEWNKTDGVKGASDDLFTPWADNNEAKIPFTDAPITSTYLIESGYPDGTTQINALFKTAATIGRQTYIGNVKQPTNAAEYDKSLILKSAIGKVAGFSNLSYIDIEVGKDEITHLESSGDRLFVFTKHNLTIVNVAQDIEFLEAEFPGYGVDGAPQVCKIGEGLAFVNYSGIYYFDGKSFQNLASKGLSTNFASGFYENHPLAISYDIRRHIILVWTTGIVYFYSLKNNTWCGSVRETDWWDSNGSAPYVYLWNPEECPTTNTVIGPNMKHYFYCNGLHATEYQVIGDDTSVQTNMSFTYKSGKITFGEIGRKKKFYKVQVRSQISRDTWKFGYSIDEGAYVYPSTVWRGEKGDYQAPGSGFFTTWVGRVIHTFEIDAPEYTKVGSTIAIKITGVPSNSGDGTMAAGFIDDITIFYREKNIR